MLAIYTFHKGCLAGYPCFPDDGIKSNTIIPNSSSSSLPYEISNKILLLTYGCYFLIMVLTISLLWNVKLSWKLKDYRQEQEQEQEQQEQQQHEEQGRQRQQQRRFPWPRFINDDGDNDSENNDEEANNNNNNTDDDENHHDLEEPLLNQNMNG